MLSFVASNPTYEKNDVGNTPLIYHLSRIRVDATQSLTRTRSTLDGSQGAAVCRRAAKEDCGGLESAAEAKTITLQSYSD
jgi:hypothetical protein